MRVKGKLKVYFSKHVKRSITSWTNLPPPQTIKKKKNKPPDILWRAMTVLNKRFIKLPMGNLTVPTMVDLRYVIFWNQNDEMYSELTTRRYITILFHQSSSALNIAPWFNWLVWISTIIFVLWHLFYNDKIILVLYDIDTVYIVHQNIL